MFKLLEKEFFVCVENAFLIKKYFDVNLRKVKTDKQDSIKLATYCYEKWNSLKCYTLQDNIYHDLLFLSRQYTQLISLKTKGKIQLSNLIDLTFPKFDTVFSQKQFLFMLDIYKKYFHPDLIKKKEEKAFIEDIEKKANKKGLRTGIRIALQLYELAQQSIPARPNNTYTKLAVSNCIKNLYSLETTSEEIISQMNELANALPEYETVCQMSGVGKKIAPRLIAEIGDIKKYKSANSLIASAGIDVPPYQSGDFTAKNKHITKRGNKYLRKCGYEVMMSLKCFKPQKDTKVYDYIIKKEKEGKHTMLCKIAGLNKFLRIYYARVKEVYNKI